MDPEIKALIAKRTELLSEAKAVMGIASRAGRDLNEEETKAIDAINGDIDAIDAKVEAAQKLAKIKDRIAANDAPAPTLTQNDNGPIVTGMRSRAESDPMAGFKNQTDFIQAVVRASTEKVLDERLRPLAAAGSDEQSGASNPFGAFLLPTALAPNALSIDPMLDPTASLVSSIPMETRSIEIPFLVDKDHSGGSYVGGQRWLRRAETQAAISSRSQLGQCKLTASALTGLTFSSNELLADSPISVAAMIQANFARGLAPTLLDEKINGTGVGQFLGVINAPATISIAKESEQTADTIVGANISKMRARAYNYGSCIWMASPDALPALTQAHLTMTNTDIPLFTFGNGLDRPDTLMGRPIYFVEQCPTLGDVGDLICANWSEYLVGTRGGVENSSSVHVRFIEGEEVFRAEVRNDGKPWWNTAMTPKNGGATLSPFVTIAARA